MKKTFSLLLAAAACVVPFTLSSCDGGTGNDNYAVTGKEFKLGAKSFYIDAMNLWTVRSTEPANNMILSGPDDYTGTVACWGEITTGSFNKPLAGIAKVYFHYTYNAEKNTGELSWSWDPADAGNAPTAALAFITTAHNVAGGGEGEGGGMGGIGEANDMVSEAEHYGQMHIDFDFNTGYCVLRCPCGAMSQNLHFDVRRGH